MQASQAWLVLENSTSWGFAFKRKRTSTEKNNCLKWNYSPGVYPGIQEMGSESFFILRGTKTQKSKFFNQNLVKIKICWGRLGRHREEDTTH